MHQLILTKVTNCVCSLFLLIGSHVLPGYYPMRRPFLQDSEHCHPMKQYSTDTYTSTLGGKPFSYDHPSSYPFIDGYYPSDTFGDYRTTSTYSSSGGSLFPSSSSLPPLLPSLSTESSSHLLLVDTLFFFYYSSDNDAY